MSYNNYDKNKSYHTIALSPEVVLTLKKMGSMGESYNDVIVRLLLLAGCRASDSVGQRKEVNP